MAILRRSASRGGGISPFKAGLLAIVLVMVGTYFAYTQANPFADAYEFSAAFHTTNNLKPDSPVRIAGIDIGTVTKVEPIGEGEDGALVTMELEDHALPIHDDAELKIRPRIFLEGNEFVDLRPGSPSADILEEGETIPVNQTATPVQFGQVLSVLESDTREDLKTFLSEYSIKALRGGGASGFRRSIRYWEDAYRDSALANDALLGTEEGDLSRVLTGQQRTFAALSAVPEDLADLVTNFNTTAAAFAQEDDALEAAIPELRDVLAVGVPALESLNSSFPGIQRFAVDALPGVRSSQVTIPESFPFIRQARLLFQPSELRGLAADLRRAVPKLARLNQRTVPFLGQNRQLSRCSNEVLLPFARTPIPTREPSPASQPVTGPDSNPNVGPLDFPFAPDSTDQPFAEQGPRSFVGLSGESRAYDANNEFFRVNFKLDQTPLTFFRLQDDPLGSPALGDAVLNLAEPEETSRPAPPPETDVPGSPVDEYRRPAFRPDFPCELSVPPDLRAPSSEARPASTPIPILEILIDIITGLGLDPLDVPGLRPNASEEEQVDALIAFLSGEGLEALIEESPEEPGARSTEPPSSEDAAPPSAEAPPAGEGDTTR